MVKLGSCVEWLVSGWFCSTSMILLSHWAEAGPGLLLWLLSLSFFFPREQGSLTIIINEQMCKTHKTTNVYQYETINQKTKAARNLFVFKPLRFSSNRASSKTLLLVGGTLARFDADLPAGGAQSLGLLRKPRGPGGW